jgi:hypothetical protein
MYPLALTVASDPARTTVLLASVRGVSASRVLPFVEAPPRGHHVGTPLRGCGHALSTARKAFLDVLFETRHGGPMRQSLQQLAAAGLLHRCGGTDLVDRRRPVPGGPGPTVGHARGRRCRAVAEYVAPYGAMGAPDPDDGRRVRRRHPPVRPVRRGPARHRPRGRAHRTHPRRHPRRRRHSGPTRVHHHLAPLGVQLLRLRT